MPTYDKTELSVIFIDTFDFLDYKIKSDIVKRVNGGERISSILESFSDRISKENIAIIKNSENKEYLNREEFIKILKAKGKEYGVTLGAPLVKAIVNSIGERNENEKGTITYSCTLFNIFNGCICGRRRACQCLCRR